MSGPTDQAVRRARQLVRCYPKSWRARYGNEFEELLVAEFLEKPRNWRRTADVVFSGSLARLARAGLHGQALQPIEQVQTGLVSLGCALAAFLAVGVALWSQLTIGWQWSRPDTLGTTMAVVMMSAVMLLFVSLAILAAVPILWKISVQVARREVSGLIRPSMLFVTGTVLLVTGARHFGNGWPGTGGHPWFGQGLVPGGVAAFAWASTLSVSAYWAHPHALLAFPTAEIAWMAISPIAAICMVVGAVKTVRRLDLSPRVLRYESSIGAVATVGMLVFAVGSCCWMVDGGPGPRNLFHAGVIDIAGVIAMVAALGVAHRATTRSMRARAALRAS
jgi:hypothetical protein